VWICGGVTGGLERRGEEGGVWGDGGGGWEGDSGEARREECGEVWEGCGGW